MTLLLIARGEFVFTVSSGDALVIVIRKVPLFKCTQIRPVKLSFHNLATDNVPCCNLTLLCTLIYQKQGKAILVSELLFEAIHCSFIPG